MLHFPSSDRFVWVLPALSAEEGGVPSAHGRVGSFARDGLGRGSSPAVQANEQELLCRGRSHCRRRVRSLNACEGGQCGARRHSCLPYGGSAPAACWREGTVKIMYAGLSSRSRPSSMPLSQLPEWWRACSSCGAGGRTGAWARSWSRIQLQCGTEVWMAGTEGMKQSNDMYLNRKEIRTHIMQRKKAPETALSRGPAPLHAATLRRPALGGSGAGLLIPVAGLALRSRSTAASS